ncbi:MAG TPA: ABC transporter permease [Allosphingosinicella sp.]|nr:ABC transporter permease [Allosphingosinicella sp.]
MWRSYLTVGVRALVKDRTYAFINIVGLAIGLAACLMLLLYVRYERSYDEWLPNVENLYQVQAEFRDPSTQVSTDSQMSAYVAGETLKKDFPQIERKVYVLSASPVVFHRGEAMPTKDAVMTDGNLFELMQVPFLHGDRGTALANVGSIVLSETEAKKYFGDENPLGRTLTLINRGISTDFRVTGVMKDLPRNSHQKFDMVARIDIATYMAENAEDFMTEWGWNSGWNYIQLRSGTNVADINGGLQAWEDRNIPDRDFGGQSLNQGDFAEWRLTNLRDIHLGVAHDGGTRPGNDERTILTFTIIAFLILGMACVNFTNLATARASARAREVALRKVLGASRSQLMTQFLLESVRVAGVAMLLALALVELLLPMLGNFLDADLQMSYFGSNGMLLPILLLTALVGAAGGLYPAFYLSRFQPAQVLKANKSTAEAAGSGKLRSALVIGQFAVSIGLIICTAVVYAQTIHARTADPGFKREGLLEVDGMARRQLIDRTEQIARQMERIPGVESVARTGISIDPQDQNSTVVKVPGRELPVGMGTYAIDDNYFRTMGVELIAGRELETERPMDVIPLGLNPSDEEQRAFAARGVNLVINERGARDLGFANPADAVGKTYTIGFVDPENGAVPMTIVGVVKDTRLRSIRQPLEPIVYRLSNYGLNTLVIRYNDPEPNAVRERVEREWKKITQDVPFQAEFSEDIVAEQYQAEESQARIFAGFALLAVVVACLGLFGLAAFTAERRTKEIGIRKVLGARTGDIVKLLAWQFSKPVIVANLIAWPVAWLVMSRWVQRYDEVARVDIGVLPFLFAGLLALVIAIGTISTHAIRVARANPIHALRYE